MQRGEVLCSFKLHIRLVRKVPRLVSKKIYIYIKLHFWPPFTVGKEIPWPLRHSVLRIGEELWQHISWLLHPEDLTVPGWEDTNLLSHPTHLCVYFNLFPPKLKGIETRFEVDIKMAVATFAVKDPQKNPSKSACRWSIGKCVRIERLGRGKTWIWTITFVARVSKLCWHILCVLVAVNVLLCWLQEKKHLILPFYTSDLWPQWARVCQSWLWASGVISFNSLGFFLVVVFFFPFEFFIFNLVVFHFF